MVEIDHFLTGNGLLVNRSLSAVSNIKCVPNLIPVKYYKYNMPVDTVEIKV